MLLRHGATRESIAAARMVAFHGFQETRAWDGPSDYIVGTVEGSCGVIRFDSTGCVGAMINYDPWRQMELSSAIASMPRILQVVANDV